MHDATEEIDSRNEEEDEGSRTREASESTKGVRSDLSLRGTSEVDVDVDASRSVSMETKKAKKETFVSNEEMLECRICHGEDELKDLDSPCSCDGSMKYVHRECVQRWCDEKGDATCEICHQPFRGYEPSPESISRIRTERAREQLLRHGAIHVDLHLTSEEERELLEEIARMRTDERMAYRDGIEEEEDAAAWCRSFGLAMVMMALLRNALAALAYANDGGGQSGGSEDHHHAPPTPYQRPTYDGGDPVDMLLRLFVFVLLPAFLLIKGLSMIQNANRWQLEGDEGEEMHATNQGTSTEVPARLP